MVVDGWVSLSIATGFTGFILLMSAIVVVYTSPRKKRIMLPLDGEGKEWETDETVEGAVEYQ